MKKCNVTTAPPITLRVQPGDTVKRRVGGEYYLVAEPPMARHRSFHSRYHFLFSLTTGELRRVDTLTSRAWEKVDCCFKECEEQ